MTPQEILSEAATTITERGKQYGGVEDCFSLAAQLSTLLLGRAFTAADVAAVQMAVKLARLGQTKDHHDSLIDLVNYTAFRAAFLENARPRANVPLADLVQEAIAQTDAEIARTDAQVEAVRRSLAVAAE